MFLCRFLATGESLRSLAFAYRISPTSISKFIPEVLQALKLKLVPKHLPPPDKIDWEKIAEEFWSRWSFPNLLGALDGKHVRIVAPDKTGSLFFNYKNYFSTVLLALVDAHCKYIIVDVGSYGKEGDAGIFNKSHMGQLIQSGHAFPEPQYLPNSNILLPHVVVGDDAFRLDKHLVKGYCKKQALEDRHKRNFNYHVSRVRRVSENAFGIMCAVFRIFFTPINVLPQTVDLIVIVCCALHNFLRDEYISNNPHYKEGPNIHELPAENMIPLAGKGGFAKSEGFKVRYRFTDYFKDKSARKPK